MAGKVSVLSLLCLSRGRAFFASLIVVFEAVAIGLVVLGLVGLFWAAGFCYH